MIQEKGCIFFIAAATEKGVAYENFAWNNLYFFQFSTKFNFSLPFPHDEIYLYNENLKT